MSDEGVSDGDRSAIGRVEIAEVLSRYGYLMDRRDWPGLDQVFTADAVFDASAVGLGTYDGLDALREGFETMRHPIAHHVTNVVVEFDPAGRSASVLSKWLAPWPGAKVATGEYEDEFALTPQGWRIRRRKVTVRTG